MDKLKILIKHYNEKTSPGIDSLLCFCETFKECYLALSIDPMLFFSLPEKIRCNKTTRMFMYDVLIHIDICIQIPQKIVISDLSIDPLCMVKYKKTHYFEYSREQLETGKFLLMQERGKAKKPQCIPAFKCNIDKHKFSIDLFYECEKLIKYDCLGFTECKDTCFYIRDIDSFLRPFSHESKINILDMNETNNLLLLHLNRHKINGKKVLPSHGISEEIVYSYLEKINPTFQGNIENISIACRMFMNGHPLMYKYENLMRIFNTTDILKCSCIAKTILNIQ